MAPRGLLALLAVNLLSSFAIAHGHGNRPSCPTPTTPPAVTGTPTTPPAVTGTPTPPPPGTPTTPPGTSTAPAPPPPAGASPAPPSGGSNGTCPINTLRLAVCANVLNLLRFNIDVPPGDDRCCPLLQGLVDLDAAVRLCLAIRAKILGVVANLPVDLSLLLNFCRRDQVPGFICPT